MCVSIYVVIAKKLKWVVSKVNIVNIIYSVVE